MKPFDTSGIDLTVSEPFETTDDLRSMLICKYGGEYCERFMKEHQKKVTTILSQP